MSNIKEKAVLLSDIEFLEMHSSDWERLEEASFDVDSNQTLNENQQNVLNWLKNTIRRNERDIMHAISHVHTHVSLPTHYNKNPYKAYYELTQIEEAEVLQAFSQWFLKQEEA